MEQILPGTIMWGKKIKEYSCWSEENRDENGVTVTLTDGSKLDAALLIGSDGIFSTVRRQMNLKGDRLNYVGIIVVLGIVEDEILYTPLSDRRIFETVDGSTRIYAMPFTKKSTMWQLSFPYPDAGAQTLVKDGAALKQEILRRCQDWHEPVPALLRATPLDCMSGYKVLDRETLDPYVLRPRNTKGKANSAERRVTLIGDAAHPMTPFRAQGANQALSDAVLLADTLVDSVHRHGPNIGMNLALPEFEKKMLTRSSKMVHGSREKAKELHSNLALLPARKVQREMSIDTQVVLKILQSKGIGAQSAYNPLGLDALVEAVIETSKCGVNARGGQLEKNEIELHDVLPHTSRQKKRPMDHTIDEKRQKDTRTKNNIAHMIGACDDGEKSARNSKSRKRNCEKSNVAQINGACDAGEMRVKIRRKKNGEKVGAKIWGYLDNDWLKCTLLDIAIDGSHRVKWKDGTESFLPKTHVRPRSKVGSDLH